MSFWSLGSKKKDASSEAVEPSTMDRLINRNCSREEFFLLYSKLLQERLPTFSIQFVGESALHIVNSEKKEQTTYLDNLWIRYKDGSEDRRDLIERFVRSAQDAGRPAAVVSNANIVAIIKDVQYVSQFGEVLFKEHLCGDLWIVYALDEPERTVTLKEEEFAATGLDPAELRTTAVRNLWRIMPAVERHGGGPWYLLTAGQDYVASLLLFDDLWRQLADSVEGDIVAVAPSRDVVMYTGSQSLDGLAAIRTEAAKIMSSGPYLISESLLIRQQDKWSLFNAN